MYVPGNGTSNTDICIRLPVAFKTSNLGTRVDESPQYFLAGPSVVIETPTLPEHHYSGTLARQRQGYRLIPNQGFGITR